jgi:hypothetical protein
MKSPAILPEVDLSLWHLGIQNQEAFGLSPDNGPDCWLKTKTFYHVKHPYEPLSLKQLCHTEILSHSLKKFKGKEKIDITDIPLRKTIYFFSDALLIKICLIALGLILIIIFLFW